ncbi:uncharacterized protein LOC131049447 [Cryptomeria japonica]|uniref:uncharacterized protein LOC131049447 n=1 Tax=Cryptomeria japonica TaxID=3369 RepID=UPI0025AC679F|nr:uncharacterized protein LOC131049447 [Cryptomeria japonica]
MGITGHMDIDENEMLGRHEFDRNYKWDEITVPNDLHDMALQFIAMAKNHCPNEPIPFVDKIPEKTLLAEQKQALAIIMNHSNNVMNATLYMIIQGIEPMQARFRKILTNIQNAQPKQDDWQLLMTRTSKELTPIQTEEFNKPIHLFSTNDMVKKNNKKMLRKLNRPVAISEVANVRSRSNGEYEDEQLEKKILLCKGQQIMLTTNIWTKAGLVNGAVGEVVNIVYAYGSKRPDIPAYVVTRINNYTGPSWNLTYTKLVPITPISLGNRRQIPLKMAWAITVHKSQGLTLQNATIDIGATERQCLTFTAISRIKTLDNLRIEPGFSFESYCKM